MIDNIYLIAVIAAMALISFALRALPFVAAQWLNKHPLVHRLGDFLPLAIMTLLPHMLVKGMLVYSGGAAHGKPYIHLGPVALDAVGNHYEECKADFEIFGRRFAEKARELFPNK